MKKSELVDAVAAQTGASKKDTEATIDALGDVVAKCLAGGDTVALPGLGSFKTASRAARTGRNPQTGEAIKIAASTVARFTAGKALKDVLNVKKKPKAKKK